METMTRDDLLAAPTILARKEALVLKNLAGLEIGLGAEAQTKEVETEKNGENEIDLERNLTLLHRRSRKVTAVAETLVRKGILTEKSAL